MSTHLPPISNFTRRQIMNMLFGTGWVGLRAFATGIPASILLNPRKALAATGAPDSGCSDTSKAQYIILSTSGSGDPAGLNTPGMYELTAMSHPTAATMKATPLTLNGTSSTAAAPWAALPQTLLDQTVFFHHGTYTVVHGDEGKTLGLAGAVAQNDMLVSMLSSQLAGCLGTVQVQPICIGASIEQQGSEALSYQGRVQPVLSPAALASVLTLPTGPLSNLTSLRDSTLNSLNAWYKANGNAGQGSFIDKYVNTQDQLRTVAGAALGNLASIKDTSPASQILAATVLFQMNLAPVVSIHIPMGGDNHGDNGLNNEATQQVAGIASMASIFANLPTALAGKVTFMSLNVFGRTASRTTGRDHNGNLCTTIMMGSGLKGGIVGGAAASGGDFTSTAIDSTTGASSATGDIPFAENFAAMGKTIGRAVGVDQAFLDANITGGKSVAAVLKNP